MKNMYRILCLCLCFSILTIGCNKNEEAIENDQDQTTLPQPLENNFSMEGIALKDFDYRFLETNLTVEASSRDTGCPAFDHAHAEWTNVILNCEYDPLYCGYLNTFWGIHTVMAAINCGLEGYCGDYCYTALNTFQLQTTDLIERRIHKDYQVGLGDLLFQLEQLCNECGE